MRKKNTEKAFNRIKFLYAVCVTTSDKPGQTDRLMSVYVGKKKNKPPKTLNIAQNQNLRI